MRYLKKNSHVRRLKISRRLARFRVPWYVSLNFVYNEISLRTRVRGRKNKKIVDINIASVAIMITVTEMRHI